MELDRGVRKNELKSAKNNKIMFNKSEENEELLL